jgi:hypothetical protein
LGGLPANPAIPLTPEVRAAYQDLYNKIQAQIDSAMDLTALEALNVSQPEVEDVLTKDDLYRLNTDTAVFNALLKQINETNDGLRVLRAQIVSTASHFAMAADILAAIDKALALVPGV